MPFPPCPSAPLPPCCSHEIGTTIGNLRDGPAKDRFDALREKGVRWVEVWFGEDGLLTQDRAFLEEAKRRFGEADLKVWSVHTSFGPAYDISVEDEAIRRRGIRDAIRCAEGVKRLGGRQVIIHGSAPLAEGSADRAARHARSVESLGQVVRACDEIGVQLALENELPNHLGDTGEELMSILERFPSLGICLDTGHAHVAGEGADLIRCVGSRISTVHLHDNDGTQDEHLLPGFGSIDWDAYSDAFAASAYRGPLMFESGGPGTYEEMVDRLREAGEGLVWDA